MSGGRSMRYLLASLMLLAAAIGGIAIAAARPAEPTYCSTRDPTPVGTACVCPPGTQGVAVNNWEPPSFFCQSVARGLYDPTTMSDVMLRQLLRDLQFRARVNAALKASKPGKHVNVVPSLMQDDPDTMKHRTNDDFRYGPPPSDDDKSSHDRQPEIPIPH